MIQSEPEHIPRDGFHQRMENALENAVLYLKKNQQADGSFDSMTAGSINSFNESMVEYHEGDRHGWFEKDRQVVFPSLLIATALMNIPDYRQNLEIEKMVERMTQFILDQQSGKGIWNNFKKTHPQYKVMPFDLDSTATALSIIRNRGIEFEAGEIFESQKNKKGRYFTFITLRAIRNRCWNYWWVSCRELLVPIQTWYFWKKFEASRHDVDGIVNANILHYLGENSGTKAVVQWLRESVLSDRELEFDKWYRNPLVIYYFLSRNHYHGITAFADFKEKLTGYARHYLSGKSSVPSNAMDTALALCVMQNYHCSGQGLASYFEQLLSMQHSDGHWDRRVFYVGGPKMIFGWGSEELTTAICVEAIGRYIQGKQGGG